MKKYTIEVNEKQLRVLEQACELLTRIGLEQYKHIFDVIYSLEGVDNYDFNHDVIDEINKKMRTLVKNEPNLILYEHASRGIANKKTPQNSKIACDLYQSMRYVRSWANAEHKPEERNKYFMKYMTVNYDEPMKWSDEVLPKIKEINNKK
jgi:hypothetical protein